MPRMTPPRPRLPDEPLGRLSLLIADLTEYAERGGMAADQAEGVYNTLMSGLARLDLEGQAHLLDRLRAWTESPKAPRGSRVHAKK